MENLRSVCVRKSYTTEKFEINFLSIFPQVVIVCELTQLFRINLKHTKNKAAKCAIINARKVIGFNLRSHAPRARFILKVHRQCVAAARLKGVSWVWASARLLKYTIYYYTNNWIKLRGGAAAIKSSRWVARTRLAYSLSFSVSAYNKFVFCICAWISIIDEKNHQREWINTYN